MINDEQDRQLIFSGVCRRILARIIDAVIIIIPATIFHAIFITILAVVSLESEAALSQSAILLSLWICWLIYAFAFNSSSYQATPGKMALGIIMADLRGQRISFGQAFTREFTAGIISIIVLGTYGIICCAMVAFTKKKQALHDMFARTLVIKK